MEHCCLFGTHTCTRIDLRCLDPRARTNTRTRYTGASAGKAYGLHLLGSVRQRACSGCSSEQLGSKLPRLAMDCCEQLSC